MSDGTNYILGISAFYRESAAALLADGEIVAAVQEERLSRAKGDARFPRDALAPFIYTIFSTPAVGRLSGH